MTLVINIIFNFVYYTLITRVLLSWFPSTPRNKFTRFIYDVTEPLLSPIRTIIPINNSRFDFSAIILFIVLSFLKSQLLLLG